MRRNAIGLIKFVIIAGLTVVATVLVFRSVRSRKQSDRWPLETRGNDFLPLESPFRQDSQRHYDRQETDEKIDWHDYKKIEEDKSRGGTGEHGKPASLPPSMNTKMEQLYKVNGFNGALSDEISLNRSVPDIRHPDCRKKKYKSKLDSVSIIVTFHNEHLTTLLRTCWSVTNRSPPELIEEILLVDDGSTKIELKQNLDEYVKKYLPKVRIIRLTERSGLIRGRLAGARLASAKVLVFLDSHSEANVNWLPPLLEPIADDYKNCVCPFIDVVAYDTFEYRAQDEGARGAFDWQFYYKRLPLLPTDLDRPTEPFSSPIMAGGYFAITAKFFWELGGYDDGLEIWGGEQYELSFKIWQCGGKVYDAPCSRVGHIYRKFSPFPHTGYSVAKNYKRVVEVWMDEYAKYMYARNPGWRNIDPGDLTVEKKRRTDLNCKPFRWFMENIAFDLTKVYPPIEPDDFAWGEIRSVGSNLCLDGKRGKKNDPVVVDNCIKYDSKIAGEQEFKLSWHRDIRLKKRNFCLDALVRENKAPVTIFPCHGQQGNQLWRYDVDRQWLEHGQNERCLDIDPTSRKVFTAPCDSSSATQRWNFENVNREALQNWDKPTIPKHW